MLQMGLDGPLACFWPHCLGTPQTISGIVWELPQVRHHSHLVAWIQSCFWRVRTFKCMDMGHSWPPGFRTLTVL